METESFPKRKRKKKWTGLRTKTDEQKLDFKKKVVEGGEDKTQENLAVIQKTHEAAAGKVAHHTKAERENFTVRKLLQDARKRSRGECSKNKPGKQGLNKGRRR